ncbi:site-2 protease family protein [Aquibacillus salsiterrae]|uniref:Site-2 protease family protein n=1 Tax=Aquibacillus salsiterrae TaxID=2950439 RepID=A0A9X3WHV9_9BACI|nr:site-2 protease family protein [Aquibacillus salsiterrae]MDC3417331.1 site-2 protease family protein [Aquibacillus salsiterrae]
MAQSKQNNSRGALGWIAVVGVFLLSKMKWLLTLLKLGKFATLISMFISLGAYALFYGWKFAAAIIYLIFVHEMGHLVAAKIKKIPTSPAVFIPFLGATIGIDPKKIKNAETEFFIAYGGPLAGLLSILPAIGLYFLTSDPYWALVTQLGALINLFNLFPVSPLDGGRIVGVLSTKIWFIGLVALIPMFFLSRDPILILIFLFGLFTWWDRLKDNEKIGVLRYEEKVLSEITRDLQTLRDYTKGELGQLYSTGYYASVYAYSAFFDQLTKRKSIVNQRLQNLKGSSLFSNTKRLQKKKWIIEKELITDTLNQLGKVNEFYGENNLRIDIDKCFENNKTRLKELKTEIKRINTYYQSSISAKIKALILYIGLAIVLALLLVFAMDILNGSNPIIR